jgi:hypothetical protein
MKKILLPAHGVHFRSHVLSYAMQLGKKDALFIYGMLMNAPVMAAQSYPFVNDMALAATPLYTEQPTEEEEHISHDNARLFRDKCVTEGVTCDVAAGTETTLDSIVAKSMYADLIVIDKDAELDSYISSPMGVSLKDLLAASRCPVMAVPDNALPVKRVILAFDGGHSSVYAIKLFTYLFSEWKNMPTALFSVGYDTTVHFEEAGKWLRQSFARLDIISREGSVKDELVEYIKEGEEVSTLVVMGAYGKPAISRLFHTSPAHAVLTRTNATVFISHEFVTG